MNALMTYAIGRVRKKHIALAIWILAGLVGGAFVLPVSFLAGLNVILGFCLIPFVVLIDGKQRINYVYLALVIFFALIAAIYHVRMFYFFALAFYILLLTEAGIGRINVLVLFLMAFMSPFFHQVNVILGFPIRLLLSEWSGHLLSWMGIDVTVEGNLMTRNGAAFTVDEACMGLNMLATSLLMGVFVIAHQFRVQQRRVSFWLLSLFFAGVFALNVVANLLRIILLVMFNIAPQDPMHEVTGIACLIVYVIIPVYLVSRWLVRHNGKPHQRQEDPMTFTPVSTLLFTGMAACMIVTAVHIHQKRANEVFVYADASLQNFHPVKLNKGITKMANDDILVYIKPIAEFFSGEHQPLLCWQGSGYTFQRIRTESIAGKEIYVANMVKPGEELYTAWWYDNGTVHTIDQIDWRLRMLKGEKKFCLVNVTADDEATLVKNLESIIGNNELTLYGNHAVQQ